jgi:hypothetical protein
LAGGGIARRQNLLTYFMYAPPFFLLAPCPQPKSNNFKPVLLILIEDEKIKVVSEEKETQISE